MSDELTVLAWSLVHAVVQILLPSILRLQETGPEYNASPRDTPSPTPERLVTARLRRAQANLSETLPLFGLAILIAHAAGKEAELTFYGAWLYLIARVIYVPLYAAGIPYLRTLVWFASLGGLLMVLYAVLAPY
jgi:uncharacterized MAPEG superfamily protein